MVTFEINVDIQKAIDKLKELDVVKIAKEALDEGGDLIMKDAKEKVHVDSGDLKASGRVEKREHEVVGGFSTDYAKIEEERVGGHRYSGPHAYLEPSVDKNAPIIHKNIERKIKEALD